MPILKGVDGVEKMSKSLGNYIGIDEAASDMYGKVMSISDQLIVIYLKLVTDVHPDDLDEMIKQLSNSGMNPRDLKIRLTREITTLYHGKGFAEQAEEYFKTVF